MDFLINMKMQIRDTDLSDWSTGLLELSRLVLWLVSQDDIILAGSEIPKMDGDQDNIFFL